MDYTFVRFVCCFQSGKFWITLCSGGINKFELLITRNDESNQEKRKGKAVQLF